MQNHSGEVYFAKVSMFNCSYTNDTFTAMVFDKSMLHFKGIVHQKFKFSHFIYPLFLLNSPDFFSPMKKSLYDSSCTIFAVLYFSMLCVVISY